MESDKINKYHASLTLAMLGDKIGFGNKLREMNYSQNMITIDQVDFDAKINGLSSIIIYKFISEGGIIDIDINGLSYSDDTIMHVDTINGLLADYKNRDELYDIILKNYLISFKDINKMKNDYLAGRQTIESIKAINNGSNWRVFPYSKNAGGNGGPMRTMCIGLAFSSQNNLLKLIESSIMICSITHPNNIAFIGSIASALFTSYAIQNINIEIWIFNLVALLESDTIDNIIEKVKPSYIEQFKEDKKAYLHKLMTYIETSFEEYNYIISHNSQRSIFPAIRMLYYYDNFATNKRIFFPGASSDDVIIIAYDCLMMAKNNFEKLIYLSMINLGDSDTIGTISGAWYGALYGFSNVPPNLIFTNDELNDTFYGFANDMIKKYSDKNINFF